MVSAVPKGSSLKLICGSKVLVHSNQVIASTLPSLLFQELGSLLCKVKGTGQVSLNQPSQRTTIQQESDMVLRPLMDLLDGR